MAVPGETVGAKVLWSGERYSLEGVTGVYVLRTYRQPGPYVLTTRAERRLASKTGGFFGLGSRWKVWEELRTPIEEQDLEQQVVREDKTRQDRST